MAFGDSVAIRLTSDELPQTDRYGGGEGGEDAGQAAPMRMMSCHPAKCRHFSRKLKSLLERENARDTNSINISSTTYRAYSTDRASVCLYVRRFRLLLPT